MRTVLMVILGVISLGLTVIVMMQSSNGEGLSSTFTGNSTEQLFGTKKGKGKEALLNKLTAIIGVVFVLITLVLLVIE